MKLLLAPSTVCLPRCCSFRAAMPTKWRLDFNRNVACQAKKMGNGLNSCSSSTASADRGERGEQDDDVIMEGLNEIANDAIQLMLGNKSKSLMDCVEDLDEAGEYLVKEGKLEAATFLLVIKNMLDHKVIPEKDELRGPYKKAFEKIWSVVEDSGWRLSMPENPNGVDMLDDELIPPILNQL